MAEEEKISQAIVINNIFEEDGAHHSSGWKVALADCMTSLFASFFVLWLMASTPVEDRIEIASVFKHPSTIPKEMGRTSNQDIKETTGTSSAIINKNGGHNHTKLKNKHKQQGVDKKHKPMEEIHKELKSRLEKSLGSNAKVTFKNNEITIVINGDTLYKPGSFQTSPANEEKIMDIADALIETDVNIFVEGHTDNTPTYNELITTNYELSGMRAARIAWIFNIVGVEGRRIVPQGLGQNFPVADNKTASGRALNRRVIIKITDASDVPTEVL